MGEHIIINILDLLDNLGEIDTKNVLSEFSCPLNQEIENFLQNNAVEFAKSKSQLHILCLMMRNRSVLSGILH